MLQGGYSQSALPRSSTPNNCFAVYQEVLLLNIAILDDSKEDLWQIKSVISSYYESRNTSADIRLYSSAESFFAKYSPGFYDLIIMDIYMGTMTGMDAARKLRDAKDTAALIFITSSDAYAVESYDV